MIISPAEKKALRRLQADFILTKVQLAESIGVSRSTLRKIINNNEPQKVNKSTYQKIMRVIAENY